MPKYNPKARLDTSQIRDLRTKGRHGELANKRSRYRQQAIRNRIKKRNIRTERLRYRDRG